MECYEDQGILGGLNSSLGFFAKITVSLMEVVYMKRIKCHVKGKREGMELKLWRIARKVQASINTYGICYGSDINEIMRKELYGNEWNSFRRPICIDGFSSENLKNP